MATRPSTTKRSTANRSRSTPATPARSQSMTQQRGGGMIRSQAGFDREFKQLCRRIQGDMQQQIIKQGYTASKEWDLPLAPPRQAATPQATASRASRSTGTTKRATATRTATKRATGGGQTRKQAGGQTRAKAKQAGAANTRKPAARSRRNPQVEAPLSQQAGATSSSEQVAH